jgi:hypothetical protein
MATNCIVYYNWAGGSGDNWCDSGLQFCCTTPSPGGTGNITGDPQFVSYYLRDLRLSGSSPCIDAGTNQDWMAGAADWDGKPRIINGRADVGAYECLRPVIDITTADATVKSYITACGIGGTINAFVVGTMWWTNGLTGASGTLAAEATWQVNGILLATGTNAISVCGTNIDGIAASDMVIITRECVPSPATIMIVR